MVLRDDLNSHPGIRAAVRSCHLIFLSITAITQCKNTMAIQSEIKYTVPDKALFDTIKSFSENACYLSVDRGTAQHTDTYFDTSGLRLYHEKIVLRLRTTESGSILTFKAQGPPGYGFHRRIEIKNSHRYYRH